MIDIAPSLGRRLDTASRAPLAVGFSGGGDSLALLSLTLDWAKIHHRPVLALSVDHGLNPDSGAWTAAAGQTARALGADWRGLAWEGVKPTTGLQAKARAARHGLLAEAAREAGARILLLGHTGDDVAEGALMRSSDAPSLGHLRSWAPSPIWPAGRGVFLLRPLLEVRRAALRAWLEAQGLTWFDDPANTDLRFARVRARRQLTEESSLPAADELDPREAELARSFVFTDGGAVAPYGRIAAGLTDATLHVLAAALLSVSGGVRPPRRSELHRLLGAIHAGQRATLAGCVVDRSADAVRITAEPGRAGARRIDEPTDWKAYRFAAACGLFETEAALQQWSHL